MAELPGSSHLEPAQSNRFSPNDTTISEVVGNRTSDPSRADIPSDESCVNLNVTGYGCGPAISRNRSEPLSSQQANLPEVDVPGSAVGPNNSYVTSTSAGAPCLLLGQSAQLNIHAFDDDR